MNSVAGRIAAPVRYLTFSGLSLGVNLGVTAGLHEGFSVVPEVSFAVALGIVFVMNFAGMRWWIFSGSGLPLVPQFLSFGLSSLAFRGMEYCGYWLLYRTVGLDYRVAAIAVIGVSFVAKYVVYGSWLFSRSEP